MRLFHRSTLHLADVLAAHGLAGDLSIPDGLTCRLKFIIVAAASLSLQQACFEIPSSSCRALCQSAGCLNERLDEMSLPASWCLQAGEAAC